MSTFGDRAAELLALISDIDYGQVQFTPTNGTVGFSSWYGVTGDRGREEANANKLLDRLFGLDFTVERHTDIGHTWFHGTWNGLTVQISTGPGAFCERVKVGTKTVPAQEAAPATTVDVFEWRCSDPILAATA